MPSHPRAATTDGGEPSVDPADATLTIVLPAFDEAERIGPALDELFGYLRGSSMSGAPHDQPRGIGRWDVLVIDDGSRDATAAIIEARVEARPGPEGSPPVLRVLRRPHAGKGAAVAAGILAAQGDLVVFTDADMATPPDQLPLLVEALRDHDVALGSRVQPDGSDRRASQPRYRRIVGRVYRRLAGWWVTGDVPDPQCGFKGFRREAGHEIAERLRIASIVFDAEIIFLARRLGYRMAIVPVMWRDVRGSRMRVRAGLMVRVGWDLFRIRLLHRGLRRPVRVAGSVGDAP